ncbi:hypothetical protein BOTBODRAFT_354559 [Botryobasidium botryosum FD-172 SS1]|uniref:Uncharacterized protein n=1 Tax=Botryobasidium botryosum (strain FD-172 SS1) TaxID=930990 RepID=A0A067MEQ2_BOTB1|nr:hypothetical protein BOTBODRAFT_354559 [Botryobasidium botryosum FD-172 SS1]
MPNMPIQGRGYMNLARGQDFAPQLNPLPPSSRSRLPAYTRLDTSHPSQQPYNKMFPTIISSSVVDDVFTVARPAQNPRAGAVPCTPPRPTSASRVPPGRPQVQRTIHYALASKKYARAALPAFPWASAGAPSTPPRPAATSPASPPPRPRAPPAPRKARAYYVSKEATAMATCETSAALLPFPRFVHQLEGTGEPRSPIAARVRGVSRL